MTAAEQAAARADEAYRTHLRHLDVCRTCQDQDACEEGRRIRRAVRAARSAADRRRTRRRPRADERGGGGAPGA